jgi:aspartyl protease family protein
MSYSQKSYRLYLHGKNLLRTPAMIGGLQKKNHRRVQLLVDTGASFTMLPVELLKYSGYDIKHPIREENIVTGKGTIKAPVVQVSWFNCLGQTIKNFEVIAYNIPANLLLDGVLGMDFLRYFRAVILLEKKPPQRDEILLR